MDGQISTFCAFTDSTPEQAQQYLALTDGNVEQAVELFFSNPDLGNQNTAAPTTQSNRDRPIEIDDDDDEEVQETGSRALGAGHSVEDDEAMARRLQEEMYGAGGSGAGVGGGMNPDDVRAPMARTTETLVGPGSDWRDDPGEMQAAVAEQLMARQQRRGGRGANPGIFNQRDEASIWAQDDPTNPEVHRQVLSRATGGASEQTSKSNLLADLFRPPFDLISSLSFSAARDEGKETEKWILVNVQDPSIFDCQVLNRDLWKNASIRETIRAHFLFLQYNKDDARGQEYMNYYFHALRDHEDAYPHIAIVDPRTGEQVKTWSGSPAPKPADFLMDLHEFLDRYSLKMHTKNPVQAKRKEKQKDVAQMSEEEMLEAAMQNSLNNGGTSGSSRDATGSASGRRRDEDPDALTRPPDNLNGKGKAALTGGDAMDTSDGTPIPLSDEVGEEGGRSHGDLDTPDAFSLISSTTPHTEPPSTADAASTTRIQFRYSGGRVVRRFLLSDPVRKLYEWLKADPINGAGTGTGQRFELISLGKNLIESLDVPIAEAGLRNGTVMVEFLED